MKRLVAIEVTADYVRGVELENPLTSNPELIRFGEVALPQGAAGESEVFEMDVVKEALKELWKLQKFSTTTVALGFGGRKVLVRDFETPLAEIEKIRSKLKFEAANLLPAQMGEAMLDFYPTNLKVSEAGLDLVEGLLIAAPKEPVEQLIAVVQSAGLEVQLVDYLAFGISRIARKAFGTDGEYLLVNVKEYSTDIIALKYGVPQMVRMIPNGLTTRPQKNGKHTGVADSTASFSGENTVADPVGSVIAGVRNTLSFYTGRGGSPTAILLAGEGALSPELQERLPQSLQLPAGLLNMSNAIELKGKNSDKESTLQAASLSILGVGMRGLKG
jgi:type IV pilus assembly protein PilM